ncbi:MAG: hypothetical protein LR005_01520 [Candidatus Pacebacteria bacterium]|nr:hypothetical protein [Candidatus Paceibacterota bacterium]
MIVAEIIPITSSILAESLSYFSATQITPGTVVTIPLRKQEIRGIVVSTSEVQNLKQNLRNQNFKIRNIITVHDETVFSSAYLNTVQQLKNYYVLPAGKLIDITYPKYITKHFDEFCYDAVGHLPPNKRQYSKSLLQKSYSERIKYYEFFLQEKIKNNESVHIICPTVLEVKKIHRDLQDFFVGNIHLLHGKTTAKKITSTYTELRKKPSVIISTAQFIDVSALNKTIIIIESDSSSYYYRAVAPKIDYRIFIEEYAKNSQIQIIFADSILRAKRFSEKTLFHENVDMQIFLPEKIKLISTISKTPMKQSDAQRIKDIDKKRVAFSPFSDEILKHIKKSVKNNEKIFFYTTRKSLSPTIMCRDCGELAQDIETKTPYSLYVKNKELLYINKITGEIIPAFDLCQFCGSWRLQTLGIGTESIKQELQKLFPEIDSYIIDSTQTKNQTEINKVLKGFNTENSSSKILIGTQKSLPFLENIDSSFIVSIDGIFYQQSYSNEERILSLVKKIYDNSKRTYIQTRKVSEKTLTRKKSISTASKEKDVLQLKFSKKLQSIIKNIQHSDEFGKTMLSQYTESLKIWSIIKTGNYLNFLKNKKNNNFAVIKINHSALRIDYTKIYHLYIERLADYQPHIKARSSYKNGFIDIGITIHINADKWNTSSQDQNLVRLLPFGERNINIEINPEVF